MATQSTTNPAARGGTQDDDLPSFADATFPDGHFTKLANPPAWSIGDVCDGFDHRVRRLHGLATLLSGWNNESYFDFPQEIGDVMVNELRAMRMLTLRLEELLDSVADGGAR